MKIKKGFMLCPVMGKTMAISTGELEKSFPGMIKMNEPSADIWRWIDEGRSLEEVYCRFAETYGVDASLAHSDVDELVEKMRAAGIFEE